MKKYIMLLMSVPLSLLAWSQTAYQEGSRELAATAAKNFLAQPVCLSCGETPAPTVNVLAYKVDNKAGYRVSGCVPGSDVELYSNPSGGHVISSGIADPKGQVNFTIAEKPAFALNHNHRNAKGIAGNAQLYTINTPDLVLHDVKLSTNAGKVSVSWAATTLTNDWTFVLQQSRNNTQFEDLGVLSSSNNKPLNGVYSISTAAPELNAVVFYRVQARKGDFSIASESVSEKFSLPAFFRAQPTVFRSSLQVVIAPEKLPATYTVTDMAGRNKLYSGKLSSVNQTLSVKLSSGSYILSVTDKKGNTSSQIIISN